MVFVEVKIFVVFVIADIFALVVSTLTVNQLALFQAWPTLGRQFPVAALVCLPVLAFELIDTLNSSLSITM